MGLADTIASIPIAENHAHVVRPLPPETTPTDFASYFTEGPAVEQALETVHYRAGLAFLDERFEGDSPEELLEARLRVDTAEYSRSLINEAGIEAIVVDTGLPRDASAASFREYTDADVYPVMRLENRIEALIDATDSFAAFETAYQDEVETALAGEHVGLKSIIAYRTGLDVRPRSRSEAAGAFAQLKEDWDGRIEHPVLLDYAIDLAVRIAGEHDAPVQFHTGFGDSDAHPIYTDPGQLWDTMKRRPETDFVLLHQGYPYVRKAGYIASVLENAYVDLGMTIPFVEHGSARVVSELLELAPASKLVYSSDAFCIPEWYYMGAERGREAVSTVLGDLVDRGLVSAGWAEDAAHRILHGTTEALYDISV